MLSIVSINWEVLYANYCYVLQICDPGCDQRTLRIVSMSRLLVDSGAHFWKKNCLSWLQEVLSSKWVLYPDLSSPWRCSSFVLSAPNNWTHVGETMATLHTTAHPTATERRAALAATKTHSHSDTATWRRRLARLSSKVEQPAVPATSSDASSSRNPKLPRTGAGTIRDPSPSQPLTFADQAPPVGGATRPGTTSTCQCRHSWRSRGRTVESPLCTTVESRAKRKGESGSPLGATRGSIWFWSTMSRARAMWSGCRLSRRLRGGLPCTVTGVRCGRCGNS